jgi:hypothetical protein
VPSRPEVLAMNSYYTAETFTPVEHFAREVQIEREEFLRQLPGAIGNRTFTRNGNLIRIPEKNGAVWIKMTELGERHLGQLDLPMMRLDFAFEGLSDTEINDFMGTYELHTLRGSAGM